VALISDFGLRDHYVAAMKAVMLGIVPDLTLVDITHEIPAQDVLSGALELAACYRDFPMGTVFLAVVDPGVGSARPAIAARASDYAFVAPDNGLLALVLARAPRPAIVELAEARYARPTISRTFEGRDRFAPAAAWLARGTDLHALGPSRAGFARLELPEPRVGEGTVEGEIVKVDRFGNLVSNIGAEWLDRVAVAGRAPIVRVGGRDIGPLVGTYGDVEAGALCALIGSSGYLEVAINAGAASVRLAAGRGTPILVTTT
jgi:S-adenosylmethionine hydrolase